MLPIPPPPPAPPAPPSPAAEARDYRARQEPRVSLLFAALCANQHRYNIAILSSGHGTLAYGPLAILLRAAETRFVLKSYTRSLLFSLEEVLI